jgi:cytochrome c-type biogenesis protein CcmH/NrfF
MIKRALASLLVVLAFAPAGAAAAQARASLTDIESEVMCVACKEPLEVAQSPQADAERAYIRGLINQGQTKQQIEQSLVGQYGPAVLGKPPAHGFNLTVYVLPPAILAAGIAILALVLPRWRRKAGAPERPVPALDQADAARLDQELARFDG